MPYILLNLGERPGQQETPHRKQSSPYQGKPEKLEEAFGFSVAPNSQPAEAERPATKIRPIVFSHVEGSHAVSCGHLS